MELPDKTVSPGRLRFGTTKSKKGCLLCKQRRIKCDEGKPNCARCIKAHRACVYVDSTKEPKQTSFVHYIPYFSRSLDPLADVDMQEKRALNIFREKMAPDAASIFCSKLWSSITPLMAVHEPPIRHAVVALATVYEQYFSSLYEPYQPTSRFALEQYGKAISHIARLQNAPSAQAVEVALLSCLLFSSLEILQGHYNSAMTHIKHGMSLLAAHDTDSVTDPDVYVPRVLFRQMFTRIASNCLEIGLIRSADCPLNLNRCNKKMPKNSPPKSLIEASFAMNAVWNRLLHFIQNHDLSAVRPNSTPEQQQVRESSRDLVVGAYRFWTKAFNALPLTSDMKPSDIAILEIYRSFVSILLRIDLNRGQTAFQDYDAEFNDIVLLSSIFLDDTSKLVPAPMFENGPPKVVIRCSHHESQPAHCEIHTCHILDMHPSATPMCNLVDVDGLLQPRLPRPHVSLLPKVGSRYLPTYSATLGIITPLFSTAVYCRNLSIRRRAQYLLSIANRKEGVIDSTVAGAVAESIINLEVDRESRIDTSNPNASLTSGGSAKIGMWWHLQGGHGRTAVAVTMSPLSSHDDCQSANECSRPNAEDQRG